MENKFKGKEHYVLEMARLREEYGAWRSKQKKVNAPFFLIYKDFENEHLKDISGGALKLFLYLGFQSKNETGECWHSVETIASFFQIDQRTVKKWIKELEDRKLIKRIQRGYKWVANTFLLPYGADKPEGDES